MSPFACCDGAIQGLRWGTGPRKLLAFHGFLDHAMSFKALAAQLPDVQVWAIDLPGHGLSNALSNTEGSFILNWLMPLARVLDDLNWPAYTIVGHSFGAILSQLLAGVDSRVAHLISLDAIGPLASTQQENMSRLQKRYDSRERPFKRRQYSTYQDLVRSRQKGVFPLSEKSSQLMAQRAVHFNGQTWSHRYDAQLRNESLWRLGESEVQQWLKQVQAKVDLALFGAQHWPGYAQVIDQRIQCIDQISVTYLDGSHHLHMEAPERVAAWLQRLL